MRILITGGHGQLGRDLVQALSEHDLLALGHGDLDVTDESAVQATAQAFCPQLVIHCAALTDTTRCEREPLLAQQVNGVGTLNVAEACRRVGATLVYISTNEVFDGRRAEPYLESDEPSPVNAYGLSKLAGERAALTVAPAAYVVRTSWLYGAGGNNFPLKVLRAARAGGEVRMVNDEVAAPTWTRDLAQAIAALLRARPSPGIYHFSNAGRASRWDWAAEVLRLAGDSLRPTPITSREFFFTSPDAPRKPATSLLANIAGAAAGITLRPWQDALAEYFAVSPPDGC